MSLSVETGTYVGNGVSGNQIITSFVPTFVITRRVTGAGGASAWKNGSMPGTESWAWDQSSGADFRIPSGILSFDTAPDGFTVGTDVSVNSSGITYHFLAIRDTTGTQMFHNRTTGTGVDNRQITGLAFTPDVIFGGKQNLRHHFKFASETVADKSFPHDGSAAQGEADFFQAFLSAPDGYELGLTANESGKIHAVTAWKGGAEVVQGSYIGDGVNDRLINVGFQPDAVFIRRDGPFDFVSSYNMVMRFASQTGDASFRTQLAGQVTNHIKTLALNGFTVGTDSNVNKSGDTYHFLAIQNIAAIVVFARPSLPFDFILKAIITNSLPIELLKRIAHSQRMTFEFNVTEIITSAQNLPFELLLGVALSQLLPVDIKGTTPLATGSNVPIESLERLAAEMNLEVEFLATQATPQNLPLEFLAGLATPSNLPVEMLGTVRIDATQQMPIEFLQGVQISPNMPVDTFGVIVLKSPTALPIESLATIVQNMKLPVDAVGIGQAVAVIFNIIDPLRTNLAIEFAIIPQILLNNILPIDFTVSSILGQKLPITFRILPDQIVTLFGEDIQFPFGRADKNP